MSANDKYKVWSDAPVLGAECPSFETLEWPELKSASEDVQKMGKVSVGNGKVTIITFCCKLNKADLYTLTVVSDFNDKYGDKVQAMCISATRLSPTATRCTPSTMASLQKRLPDPT